MDALGYCFAELSDQPDVEKLANIFIEPLGGLAPFILGGVGEGRASHDSSHQIHKETNWRFEDLQSRLETSGKLSSLMLRQVCKESFLRERELETCYKDFDGEIAESTKDSVREMFGLLSKILNDPEKIGALRCNRNQHASTEDIRCESNSPMVPRFAGDLLTPYYEDSFVVFACEECGWNRTMSDIAESLENE